jgi:hypothetical protein
VGSREHANLDEVVSESHVAENRGRV